MCLVNINYEISPCELSFTLLLWFTIHMQYIEQDTEFDNIVEEPDASAAKECQEKEDINN